MCKSSEESSLAALSGEDEHPESQIVTASDSNSLFTAIDPFDAPDCPDYEYFVVVIY